MAQVVASRGTPGDPYAGLFTLPTWPAPNTLYYFVVGGLGRVLPLEWVSKLLLSLALLGTPPSTPLTYHVVWNHGTVADTFARWPVQPIRITRRWRMPRFSLRRPDPYDYVLSGRPLRSRRLILLGRSGLYRLYGVR